MVATVLVCTALLTAQSSPPAEARDRPEGGAPAATAAATAEALATYNRMREKTPETAAAQWKLGLWCEQHGLPAEAYAHFATVVRLDPKRDAAWKKLGYQKVDGRWLTEEQAAEDAERKKNDAVWTPRLKKIHKDIHGRNGARRQEAAQAALDAIDDPAACSAVFREFVDGGPRDQDIAMQVFGQIDSPVSSKVLAVLSVYGKTAEVRRRATETLRRRPKEDYLNLLVSLLADPLKYEVKPVNGPGSPGVLLVNGEKFNVRRLYAAPPPPNMAPRPGDIVTYDTLGMPVITRSLGYSGPTLKPPGSKKKGPQFEFDYTPAVQVSASQALREAGRAAAASQAQLASDVARIDDLNDRRQSFNDLVMAVMRAATGEDAGTTPEAWRAAVPEAGKYARQTARTPEKPTFDVLAPVAYQPAFAQVGFALMPRLVVDH